MQSALARLHLQAETQASQARPGEAGTAGPGQERDGQQ